MYYPDYSEFESLAKRGNLVPVYRDLDADLETPISVYLKLRGEGESFLFESVEGGEQLARYSFLAVNPDRVISLRGDRVTIREHARVQSHSIGGRDPLDLLRSFIAPYCAVPISGLPRFVGGAVGFLSYDVVRSFERLPDSAQNQLDMPDATFLLIDNLIAFDHVKHRALVIANAYVNGNARKAYDDAIGRIENIVAGLNGPVPLRVPVSKQNDPSLDSAAKPQQFEQLVERAKDHIAGGDIFQVVLSQRFCRETHADPFSTYRALRRLNPSPYMFFLDFGEMQLIGASPEVLVRLEDGVAQLNPIAGTRPRGVDATEDAQLERELRDDPKERAEHVMLVDLGRNDLGRVCEFGSIKIPDYMKVEKYSHVMHLVSRVVGDLHPELDAFDLLRATFPAG
ncbi:MAG: anthranilate synthase component I family protein, partial [Acidobacteriota bacterium]